MKLIGIYAKNCEGWAVTDLACCISNIASVTLYDTLGAESSEYIIKQWELKTVVCTSDHIRDLVEVKTSRGAGHLSTLISLNEVTTEERNLCEENGMEIYYIDELIQLGEVLNISLEDPK